jgi:23S rRNA pseudouridine955/2504/2580 synthase
LPILYEDEALIAIDKPAGLAVHGGSGVAFGVIEQLRAARPDAPFLELVHRLDRDTSGALLVAKKRSALTALHASFRDGAVDKRYLVLVKGRWRDALRKVELPLTRFVTDAGERRVRIDDDGKRARTVFRRRQVWPSAEPPLTPMSLLEAELHTGRTHQIRVHLAHLGFPLAGDEKYGDFAWNRGLAKQGLGRMFLHAWRLGLPHPLEDRRLDFESPLPDDLATFIATLAGADSRDGAR